MSSTFSTASLDICSSLQQCEGFRHLESDESGGDYADDATWVLTSSFVILTMQSGFGLLEMGHSMPGHEINIMLKNVYDVVFGALAYYFVGYGISYGSPSIPFMGLGDFFPDGDPGEVDTGLIHARYLFQFSFAATSTTIVSGCVAMRMRFSIYCAFSFFAVVVYAFCAHWVWADDGWLNTLGVHDFAGAGPVHVFGGMNGLLGILLVGPRTGRFDKSRPKSDFVAFSPTSTLFGLFILWWGWIGFNCGSSFGITDHRWLIAVRAGVNTINSTAGGGVAAIIYSKIKTHGKFIRPNHVVNGILGSLVGITASCASVHTWESLIIGFIGSFIANMTNEWVKHTCQLDDPVGAIGVHLASGMWSALSVGLFSHESLPGLDLNGNNGLFHGGGMKLLGLQTLEIVIIVSWATVVVGPFFYLCGVAVGGDWQNPRKGLRLPKSMELLGSDEVIHGGADGSIRTIVEESKWRLPSFGSLSKSRKKKRTKSAESSGFSLPSSSAVGILDHSIPEEGNESQQPLHHSSAASVAPKKSSVQFVDQVADDSEVDVSVFHNEHGSVEVRPATLMLPHDQRPTLTHPQPTNRPDTEARRSVAVFGMKPARRPQLSAEELEQLGVAVPEGSPHQQTRKQGERSNHDRTSSESLERLYNSSAGGPS